MDSVGISRISVQQAIHNATARPMVTRKMLLPPGAGAFPCGDLLVFLGAIVGSQKGGQHALCKKQTAVEIQVLITVKIVKVGLVHILEDNR